ncbi:MAG: heme-binding protein [Gammaproteobacteria bacterium]|jgi:uncharacterized protein GlcG (DUF336 family)
MASSDILEYGNPILLEKAKVVVAAAEKEARDNDFAAIIAVVDSAAQLVALHRLAHAQFGSIDVAIAKAVAAVKFKRPTKAFEDALSQGGVHLRLLSIDDAIAVDGGLPLIDGNRLIGAIGVAGMLPAQDAQVASAGAAAISRVDGH